MHEDIDAVLSLWRTAGAPETAGMHRDGLRGLLDADGDALVVAEADGQIVGSVIAAWDGWRGNLYRLAVHPHSRRRGLGTALVRAAEKHLLARNAGTPDGDRRRRHPRALDFSDRREGRAPACPSAHDPLGAARAADVSTTGVIAERLTVAAARGRGPRATRAAVARRLLAVQGQDPRGTRLATGRAARGADSGGC